MLHRPKWVFILQISLSSLLIVVTYYYSTITAQASRTIYHIPKIIIPSTSRSIRLVYLLIAASSNSVVLEKDLQHHWNVSRKEQEISSSINIIVAAIHLSNSVRCLFKASTKQLQYNGSYTFCSYNFTGFCYCDSEEKRAISSDQGQKLADELSIAFLEVSAKRNINIEKAFCSLASNIKKAVESSRCEQNGTSNTSIDQQVSVLDGGNGRECC